MRCSNPDCNRSIGLLTYRRSWFGRRRYCSKQCRDTVVIERLLRSPQEQGARTYFDWLFSQPVEQPRSRLLPAVAHPKARQV